MRNTRKADQNRIDLVAENVDLAVLVEYGRALPI
jgi:hypothetical protein